MKIESKRGLKLGVFILLMTACSIFYYFGEVARCTSWFGPCLDAFDSTQQIHSLVFLAPILYAGYFCCKRTMIIVSICMLMTFLPRAFFLSHYSDSLLRIVLFAMAIGAAGYLVAHLRQKARLHV